MSVCKNGFHLLRIVHVLVQYNLEEFVVSLDLLRPYRALFKLYPQRWRRGRGLPRGERLRAALQELGPVFVKFGQVLSTRPDLLPDDLHHALTKLQDAVPPFPADQARQVIQQAYGEPLETHFRQFGAQPAASASVAQVHFAELHDGSEVVVKILRPGIQDVIERDLELLHLLARLVDRYWAESRRLKPRELVAEYDQNIHDELDLMREAANASQLKANFAGSDMLYVPTVYWPHCRRNVMVMERIHGISIRDVARLKQAGIDMRRLAHNGVEIFFTQAFRDGFFHADMHPGNIFVSPDGQYRAVDFGIMGSLSAGDKRYLAENFLAFFDRDYHAVAEAHVRAGWVPPDTNTEAFEAAVRTVCEPIFAKPISEISFGHFLIDLFRVAHRFKMPVQPQLVLLQKTILNIEGLGRQLYPQLDLWATAKPFLGKWMSDQIGPRAAIKTLRRELPNLFTLAPELPALAHQLLYRLKNDDLRVQTHDRQISELKRQIAGGHRRLAGSIAAIGLLLTAAVLIAVQPAPGGIAWRELSWPIWLCIAAGCLLLIDSWVVNRGGR